MVQVWAEPWFELGLNHGSSLGRTMVRVWAEPWFSPGRTMGRTTGARDPGLPLGGVAVCRMVAPLHHWAGLTPTDLAPRTGLVRVSAYALQH